MFQFDHSYTNLPEAFYAKVSPAKVHQPGLCAFNRELANDLGLDYLNVDNDGLAQIFTGQKLPDEASSIALAYAGHQFGNFVPQLGDGRALLIGEVISKQGQRFDIQLKGSGPTPFSRNGDGKSSLGPVIREYILSEAMHHLGVPTTRALAATTTGEDVYREQALPGGVFTRVASSHLRIGTFEYFAARDDLENLKKLADYAIDRHYPAIQVEGREKYLELLKQVAKAHAKLVSLWMSYGFIHGVMNTDNMSIAGETIDYGPCAFMDNFSMKRVFSSIDRGGRYSYENQIPIAKWNLSRLASCLIALVHEDQAISIKMLEQSLKECYPFYQEAYYSTMGKKFGLVDGRAEDENIFQAWFNFLEAEDLDFTLSFRALSENPNDFIKNPKLEKFKQLWLARVSDSLESESKLMKSVNPVYIPRNHQVEAAIQAAQAGDLKLFHTLNQLFKNPFDQQPEFAHFETPPKPEERVQATFCGT